MHIYIYHIRILVYLWFTTMFILQPDVPVLKIYYVE